MKPVVWSERVVARFFEKVREDPISGCWNWTAFKDPKGYGRFQYGTADARLAYNVSYGLFIGNVPDELQLDHLCRNTSCVNPWHLEPVTGTVNQERRRGVRTRCPHGHEYTTENSYISPSGDTVCRTCRKRSQRAVKDRLKAERAAHGPKPRGRPTHCKHGHAFDEANTYIKNGVQYCRACRARRERERRAAGRA